MRKTSDHHRIVLNSPSISGRVAAVLWLALSLFILYGSLGDLSLDVERVTALPGWSLPDILQNVLLYWPFGVFGLLALRRLGESTASTRIRVIGLAAVYSTIMELVQVYSASRIASPLDVAANVAGAGIGAVSSPLIDAVVAEVSRRLRPTGMFDAPARFALLLAVIVACAIAWYPFDITLDVSTLSERTRAVRNDPWLYPHTTELVTQAIRYALLSGILTASLPGLRRRAPIVAALITLAAAIMIDLGQLGMGSRPVGLATLLAQAAGGCAGAAGVFFTAGDGKARYADA